MLLDFRFKNWLSFNSEVNFTMMATRERDPYDRLATDPAFNGRLLPITAIYGYNASGKTNFIEALDYLRDVVTVSEGMKRLEPFAFISKAAIPNSTFSISFLSNGTAYLYSIELNSTQIIYEKLSVLRKTTETIQFERINNELKNLNPHLDNEMAQRLKIIMQGTAPTQTFLFNTVSQQVDLFRDAYSWFKDKLVIISYRKPSMGYLNSYDDFNEILRRLDIRNSKYVSTPLPEEATHFNPQFLKNIKFSMPDGHTIRFNSTNITKVGDQLQFSSIAVRHSNLDDPNTTTDLDPSAESEGMKRLYELGTILRELLLKDSEYTFVIDELDRSLHPLLVRHLVELFNECCTKSSRKQLIFSCHDSSLLDQELMRRDSYWIINKNYYGESSMQRITNLKQGKRTDKSIRNAYMAGELGVSPSFS